jgi:hypothetical protein
MEGASRGEPDKKAKPARAVTRFALSEDAPPRRLCKRLGKFKDLAIRKRSSN